MKKIVCCGLLLLLTACSDSTAPSTGSSITTIVPGSHDSEVVVDPWDNNSPSYGTDSDYGTEVNALLFSMEQLNVAIDSSISAFQQGEDPQELQALLIEMSDLLATARYFNPPEQWLSLHSSFAAAAYGMAESYGKMSVVLSESYSPQVLKNFATELVKTTETFTQSSMLVIQALRAE